MDMMIYPCAVLLTPGANMFLLNIASFAAVSRNEAPAATLLGKRLVRSWCSSTASARAVQHNRWMQEPF